MTHWLAEILNAAHIMYYQTVIDVKYSTPDSTGEYGILECQTVIEVKNTQRLTTGEPSL